jgi:hypothetical protein
VTDGHDGRPLPHFKHEVVSGDDDSQPLSNVEPEVATDVDLSLTSSSRLQRMLMKLDLSLTMRLWYFGYANDSSPFSSSSTKERTN